MAIKDELVPLIYGTIQNQPCIYGELVEGHSVYCNNDASPWRKCHHSWYYGREQSITDKRADEDCEFFSPNPNFKEVEND